MLYTKHQESFTIVVLIKNTIPGYFQASWMHDLGIINEDEWRSAKIVLLAQNVSEFYIGDIFHFVSNPQRIQIGTTDITKISRLVSICQGIIESINVADESFTAVGINTDFAFSFSNKEDSIRFGDYFVPFKRWELFSKNPRTVEFSVSDQAPSNMKTPRRIVKFNTVGMAPDANGKQIPIVNAMSNYHFEIKGRDEVMFVINNASDYFMGFIRFIESFLEQIDLTKDE